MSENREVHFESQSFDESDDDDDDDDGLVRFREACEKIVEQLKPTEQIRWCFAGTSNVGDSVEFMKHFISLLEGKIEHDRVIVACKTENRGRVLPAISFVRDVHMLTALPPFDTFQRVHELLQVQLHTFDLRTLLLILDDDADSTTMHFTHSDEFTKYQRHGNSCKVDIALFSNNPAIVKSAPDFDIFYHFDSCVDDDFAKSLPIVEEIYYPEANNEAKCVYVPHASEFLTTLTPFPLRLPKTTTTRSTETIN